MAKKGEWVTVKNVILPPGERAPQVPQDTAATPLVQWVKGHLQQDAALGEQAQVITRTGRTVKGEVVEEVPGYHHSFGAFIPQLQQAQESAKKALWGDEA